MDRKILSKESKPSFVGYYPLVGGKLEPPENPFNTALRETFEETELKG